MTVTTFANSQQTKQQQQFDSAQMHNILAQIMKHTTYLDARLVEKKHELSGQELLDIMSKDEKTGENGIHEHIKQQLEDGDKDDIKAWLNKNRETLKNMEFDWKNEDLITIF